MLMGPASQQVAGDQWLRSFSYGLEFKLKQFRLDDVPIEADCAPSKNDERDFAPAHQLVYHSSRFKVQAIPKLLLVQEFSQHALRIVSGSCHVHEEIHFFPQKKPFARIQPQ
jgi:hypothetical protein